MFEILAVLDLVFAYMCISIYMINYEMFMSGKVYEKVNFFGKSMDRISNLPDSILCHILSFLPTKYAVGTSILSKRWQFLWASVPNFDFSDDLLFNAARWETGREAIAEVELIFTNFVDRVLLLSELSCLKKFRLDLQSCSNYDLVSTWICFAIKRKVQELNLYFFIHDIDYFHVRLPSMVFTSKTLVVLILWRDILVEVPDSVWLPSLKILILEEVLFENEDSLPKLLSGCPILEELNIARSDLDTQQVLNVSAPTVRHLMVSCHLDYFGESTVETIPRFKLMVDGPRIKELTIQDYVSDEFILKDISSLSKATIEVGRVVPDHIRCDSYGSHICKLLSGIAHVESLSLHYSTMSFLSDCDDYVLPRFHNLTCLDVYPAVDPGWKLLVDLLECSPNLALLNLKQGCLQGNSEKCWSSPLQVPNCLLFCLKEIKIQEFYGLDYEIDGVEYLLENAKVLKKMTINCQRLKSEQGFRVRKELATLPRSSISCQLNLIF